MWTDRRTDVGAVCDADGSHQPGEDEAAMTVMTITTPATVTPIFDELAARLGLVWDVESTPDETDESIVAIESIESIESVTDDAAPEAAAS
jgi:hypothetical protein